MRYFGGAGPESAAMALHQDLVSRQAVLDTKYDGLAGYGIGEPRVFAYELEDGHQLLVVDESDQPGGAFKSISSAASVATVPKGTEEVVATTAGNFGITLAVTALRDQLRSRSFTPFNLTDEKRRGMEDAGMVVEQVADSVAEAMPFAEAYVEKTSGAVLLHPYNNPWGIAGLRYMGQHVRNAVLKRAADDALDIDRPTDIFIPQGGGSAAAGVASDLYGAKHDGDMPENVSLYTVRPPRVRGGMLNERFDGLRVEVPGSNTAPFLEDRRFVQGRRLIEESSVADGTRLMAEIDPTQYEANALITVGAVLQWIADNPGAKPRNFVAVLTGRNTSPEQYNYFMNLPGYRESAAYAGRRAEAVRRSGAMAAHRAFKRNLVVNHGVVEHLDPRRGRGAACLGGVALRP
jgi:threonine dehydratase